MVEKQLLKEMEIILIENLKKLGGKSHFVPICRLVWGNHENWIRRSENMLFIWQYELGWAATRLRKKGIMLPDSGLKDGTWELAHHKPDKNE